MQTIGIADRLLWLLGLLRLLCLLGLLGLTGLLVTLGREMEPAAKTKKLSR